MSRKHPEPSDLLRFSSVLGRIEYGAERLLLVSADAMGKLRHELYEVLGPVMAHEILFRFGFHDGSLTARVIRDRMPGASPREVLEAGPLVHTLEGMARVVVGELEYGDQFVRMTGTWEDSFEAYQSLSLIGETHWTACWMLTGFASGYASEATGQSLICIERSCRAQGAETCRFEILPSERFPGLARKVEALRQGLRLKERMKPTITSLWEKAFVSSAYLARILKDSADAILTVDGDEVIRTWNRGAEELLGYAQEEAVGRHFGFLVPEDLARQGEIDMIRTETANAGSLRNYETRRVKKDGEEVHVSLTRTSIYDAHGRYIGASAILRDITEEKRLVEQLIQAEALAGVGELAAQVAHEIKNPLAGISGAMQVIADTAAKDDPRREIFLEILEHIGRLDRTVLSLLEFTRPYRPAKSKAGLDLIVDSAVSLLVHAKGFGDVEILRTLDPELGPVFVDSQQFIQVVLNILLNAAQALREDRRIFIRMSAEAEGASLTVEDRGVGMTAEVMRGIFKPFFTLRHQGTGLGLPIARKIVEGHGGTIRVESEPGKGTIVTVLIPGDRSSPSP